MSYRKARICVVGCGPSGMSVLYHYSRIPAAERPDIVCYEKQTTWLGLWNVTWKTGTDEFGEHQHCSQYKHLWTNSPKECHEFPYYTFEEHFGKPIPSFLPGPVMRNYLEGRMRSSKENLKRYVKFATAVRRIEYHAKTDDFTVLVQNLADQNKETTERFTHVIVATGIFSVPRFPPAIPGQETFPGRVLHSHDFRDAREYQDQRLLIVGFGNSGKDVASMTIKFGANNVVISGNVSRGLTWPPGISERPMIMSFDGRTAYFKDSTSSEFDTVIFCTGYQAKYPFLPDDLRLTIPENTFYPDGLYKGVLFTTGGNNKLMYLGTQNQYFSMVMFDIQAQWALQYITGRLEIPKTRQALVDDIAKWTSDLLSRDSKHSFIYFQRDYIVDLLSMVESATITKDDIVKMTDILHRWKDHKYEYYCSYRDHQFRSVFTGNMSPLHHTPWMAAYDDSFDTFVNQTPNRIT